MQISAQIKYLRFSPKKLKALGKIITGQKAQEVIDRLGFAKDKGSKLIHKALKSAYYNAVNNLKKDGSTLRVKTVEIGKGPLIKRWQPVSRGMAHQIKKRMSHIKVTLEETIKEKGSK